MRVKSKIGKWVLALIIRGFKFVKNGENGEWWNNFLALIKVEDPLN